MKQSEKLDLIENEFAPILPKFSFTRAFRESVAVRLPTSEVIPIAIIIIVSIDLSLLLLIDLIETLKFSLIKGEKPSLAAIFLRLFFIELNLKSTLIL